jgi:hypothetical protein
MTVLKYVVLLTMLLLTVASIGNDTIGDIIGNVDNIWETDVVIDICCW